MSDIFKKVNVSLISYCSDQFLPGDRITVDDGVLIGAKIDTLTDRKSHLAIVLVDDEDIKAIYKEQKRKKR